jgi:hypothetical protein
MTGIASPSRKRVSTELPDPDRIAAAVLQQCDVAGLHGGVFGEVATYLPGRRVTGVQVASDRISVHITARLRRPLHHVAHDVRAVVLPLAAGLPVDIVIEEVVMDNMADSNS